MYSLRVGLPHASQLRQDFLHHPPIHIRYTIIPPSVAECEPLVVEAEEVEEGSVEVMDVNSGTNHSETQVLGRPKAHQFEEIECRDS